MSEKLEPFSDEKAQAMMSQREKGLSGKREDIVKQLDTEQKKLLSKCQLHLEGAEEKIVGTIDGKKVTLIIKSSGNEPGNSTIDGQVILPSLANQLYKKFIWVARVQDQANTLESDKTILAEISAQELMDL